MVAAAVYVAGLVAEMAGWWRIERGRADVWRLMAPVLAAMAVAAVLVAERPVPHITGIDAAAIGAGSGLALYVATRGFVWVANRWSPFRRHTVNAYRQASTIPLPRALTLSLLVMVPAEELFWRGLGMDVLGPSVLGAVVGWALYVLANVPSRSLPILAGAVVGGAVWTAVAWWTGGVLAPLVSHILWTGCMLVLPPKAGREVARA
jgi:uncharacterized protein